MGNLTRRQILLGGGAIVGAGLVPAIPTTSDSSAFSLISKALGADIPKPDQLIRMSSNENPYGPSRVALQAIAENMHLTNRYAANPTNLIKLVADINNISPDHVMTGTGSSEILNVAGLLALLSLCRFKSHRVIFVELDSLIKLRMMNEVLLSILALDESVSFLSVKPFYCSFHFYSSLKSNAPELMQYLLPVGLGPSLKT